MNTENMENVNNAQMDNPVRRYALQRINLYIAEARQLGKSEDEIKELVRQFDEQKEIMEAARKQIEKEQNENPYEMGGRTR